MADRPTLSICIPAYNYGRFLATAIESALAQTEPADEIIVSDNHSTDNTAEVLRHYGAGVRAVRPPAHLAHGDSFYYVLSQATCSHVVFLAADDALAPSFIHAVKPHLPENGLVVTGRLDCDASMRVTAYQGASYFGKRLLPPRGFSWFLRGCSYSFSGAVFRRDLIAGAPRLPPDAGPLIDWHLALVVGAVAPVRMLWQPLHFVRLHGANDSHSNAARWRARATTFFDFLVDDRTLDDAMQAAAAQRAQAFAVELLDRPLGAYQSPWREPIEQYCRKWLGDREALARSAAQVDHVFRPGQVLTTLRMEAHMAIGQALRRLMPPAPPWLRAGPGLDPAPLRPGGPPEHGVDVEPAIEGAAALPASRRTVPG
jgi:hypothetical protein